MSLHTSIFLLRHYVEGGELSEAEVAHVSRCPGCAQVLQRMARQALAARFPEAPSVPGARAPVLAVFVAVTACLVVMMPAVGRSAGVGASCGAQAVAPEGVHGVRSSYEPAFGAPTASRPHDGGSPVGD